MSTFAMCKLQREFPRCSGQFTVLVYGIKFFTLFFGCGLPYHSRTNYRATVNVISASAFSLQFLPSFLQSRAYTLPFISLYHAISTKQNIFNLLVSHC